MQHLVLQIQTTQSKPLSRDWRVCWYVNPKLSPRACHIPTTGRFVVLPKSYPSSFPGLTAKAPVAWSRVTHRWRQQLPLSARQQWQVLIWMTPTCKDGLALQGHNLRSWTWKPRLSLAQNDELLEDVRSTAPCQPSWWNRLAFGLQSLYQLNLETQRSPQSWKVPQFGEGFCRGPRPHCEHWHGPHGHA